MQVQNANVLPVRTEVSKKMLRFSQGEKRKLSFQLKASCFPENVQDLFRVHKVNENKT